MSIKINYSNKAFNKLASKLVLFTDEKFNLNNLKKTFPKKNLII